MSYFFRQQQLQRELVAKRGVNALLDSLVETAVTASSLWRPEDHPRGKTTPESTEGSFRPKGGDVPRAASGRKITPAVHDDLKEIQRIGYLKLHRQELRSVEEFDSWAQGRMRDLMGPGYEDLVRAMTAKIWTEFRQNATHTYRGPSSWSDPVWAVKNDLRL